MFQEKGEQETKVTAALRGMSSKLNSRTWENFTRSELRLVSAHQEPPHADLYRKGAANVAFLMSSRSCARDNVRNLWA